MIRGTVGRSAMPFASRTGRPQRGACLGLVGVLAVGAPLLAQPPGTEGLRDEVEAQFRVIATGGGIGLLPRGDDGGVALIELRGEAVYVDGDGPLSVQGLTDALGAAAAPLLRLRRLDAGRQRSVLGLPPVAGVADDDAAAAAGAAVVTAAPDDTVAATAAAPDDTVAATAAAPDDTVAATAAAPDDGCGNRRRPRRYGCGNRRRPRRYGCGNRRRPRFARRRLRPQRRSRGFGGPRRRRCRG